MDWFRTRLLEERARVAAEMTDHGGFPEELDGDRQIDTEEQASRIAEELVESRIVEDRGNLLRKIDFALERLDGGIYDQCAHCGITIPLERLRAKPSVSLCISCQQARDGGELALIE